MLRHVDLPSLATLLAVDEDGFVIEPSPEWLGSALRSLHDEAEDDLDGPSFRSLLDHPEVLSKAWQATSEGGRSTRKHRAAH